MIHLIMFMGIFFFYHNGVYEIMFTISKSALAAGAPVVFRSLPAGRHYAGIAKQSALKTNTVPAQPKKEIKPTMTVAHLAAKKENVAVPKKPQKKKKTSAKKVVAAKKAVPKKVEKKKEELVKPIIAQQKSPEKPAPEIAPVAPLIPAHADAAVGQELEELSLMVGADAQTVAAAHEFQLLQEEIAQYWHPPAGIDNSRPCVVKICVGFDGKPFDIEISKSSGVLMYDVAARTALRQTMLPKWTYGKRLVIAFAQ
jgi:outer membrane biosynthesis protein TonB